MQSKLSVSLVPSITSSIQKLQHSPVDEFGIKHLALIRRMFQLTTSKNTFEQIISYTIFSHNMNKLEGLCI